MGIAIPSYGTPGFVYNEDEYFVDRGFGTIGNKNGSLGTTCPQEVIISCPHKNTRVSGVLKGGVKLDGQAQWTEMMGGGIMSLGGSLIETGNNFLQFVKGSSIQQPWMNRKMWQTTKPFSFDIPMSFVATTDPLQDVLRPIMALYSYICPRELSTSSGDSTNVISLLEENGMKVSDSVKQSVMGSALQSLNFYNIPGPALKYGTKSATEDDQGDPVYVVIGKMFAFGACYIENVHIETASSFDFDGFPIAAEVSVKATVMDSCVCQTDGNFMIQEFSNASESMSQCLDAFSQTGSNLAANLANIVEKGIGFYKTTLGK